MGAVVTSGYVLDTNHLSKAVRTGSVVQRRIAELRAGGVKIGTCVPVLCEIEAGIQQVNQPEEYRLSLGHCCNRCPSGRSINRRHEFTARFATI